MEDCAVAVVTDAITYSSTYQPLERPPDYLSLQSLIPRGIRRFFIDTATEAKPVNDEIEMFLTAVLPNNFAYLLRSVTYQISVDTASDWEGSVIIRMFNAIPGQPGSTEAQSALTSLVTPVATSVNSRTLRGDMLNLAMFTGPFWSPDTSTATTFRLAHFNTAAAVGAIGTVRSHVDFYEYDLVQAQRYYVNTPIPVMAR